MGRLVEGVWRDEGQDSQRPGGRFVRGETQFRNWITADGSAGPTGEGGFSVTATLPYDSGADGEGAT